jgi:Fic-DOC domain mobile mystery protein B
MDSLFESKPGATPLEEEDKECLKLSYISTRGELDAAENQNILNARQWLRKKKLSVTQVLKPEFIKTLHKQMFGEVWTWAGKYRERTVIIGNCPHYLIGERLKNLLDDVKEQLNSQSYEPTEIALRFHHRLVQIHPFANGNGRHSRLMTDVLQAQNYQEGINWNQDREEYLKALRHADEGNYITLLTLFKD